MWTDSINLEKANLIYVSFFISAELPPRPLLERLAKELRRQLVAILISPFYFVTAVYKSLLPLIIWIYSSLFVM